MFPLQTEWTWKYFLETLDSWSGKVSDQIVLGVLWEFQGLLLNHSWQAAAWYNAIAPYQEAMTSVPHKLLAYNYQELYQAMTSAPLYNSYPTFVFSTTTNCICKKKRGGGGVSGGFFFSSIGMEGTRKYHVADAQLACFFLGSSGWWSETKARNKPWKIRSL